MVVVDSSAILEILLNRPRAGSVGQRLSGEPVSAPYLIDIEVLHVLRRFAFLGSIDVLFAQEAIANYQRLPIQRHPHEHLLGVVWQLRDNFTAYDAIYVALALALRATFLTSDLRLARAAESLLPVEVFA